MGVVMGISTDKPDLFAAILAMDSYNRGYNAGIKDDNILFRLPGTRIGRGALQVWGDLYEDGLTQPRRSVLSCRNPDVMSARIRPPKTSPTRTGRSCNAG